MIKDFEFNPYLVACANVTEEMNPDPGVGFKVRTVRWFELLLFTESNKGHTLIGDRHIPNPAGSIMLRYPGTVMESISSFACYNIVFDTSFDPALIPYYTQGHFDSPTPELLNIMSEKNCDILSQIPETLTLRDITPFTTLFEDAMNLHLRRPDNYYVKSRRILYAIFDRLLDEIKWAQTHEITHENPANKKLKISQDWMKANYSSNISLEIVARRTGYTKEAYCRLYKKLFGQSPINFLIDQRLLKSKELLLTTNMTLESITEQIGFNSTSHFCTTFKGRVGISPGKYRKNHRQ